MGIYVQCVQIVIMATISSEKKMGKRIDKIYAHPISYPLRNYWSR